MSIRRFKKFNFNGWKFRTKDIEKNASTQNSGIAVKGIGTTTHGELVYYVILTDMIELDYYEGWKVVVFKCKWVDMWNGRGFKQDSFGFTLVNFNRLWETNEPFVLASQATQVIHTLDTLEESWNVVTSIKPRGVYNMGKEDDVDDVEIDFDCLASIDLTVDVGIYNDIITESKIVEADGDDLKCDDDSDNEQEADKQDELKEDSDDSSEDETLFDYDDSFDGWNTNVMS